MVHDGTSATHCPEGCFVDDVGQLRAGGTGRHAGNGVKIYILCRFDLLGVNLQNSLPALQVRQLHGYSPVKPTGAGECRVQGLRPVCGGQDDDASIFFKAVHLGEKLVEGLFPFVIAAHAARVTLLADGVDFIDKHNAGGFLLCLLEQITNLGSAHTNEHFDKFRARDREEGYVGLPSHNLGQHRLTSTRRTYQQDSFRHGSTCLCILFRVMEIIYDFGKAFFCLIFPCNIRKTNSFCGLNINLCVALAHAKGEGVFSSSLLHQFFAHILSKPNENQHGKNKGQKKTPKRGNSFRGDPTKLCAGIVKPFRKARILHRGGLIDQALLFIRK